MTTPDSFSLQFDTTPAIELDEEFALLADQDYNYGNSDDWFGHFRRGLYGFYARLLGTDFHYSSLHDWAAGLQIPAQTECHLADFFFNADSAIECFTYALNALGNCVAPEAFIEVSRDENLRRIKPDNIIGSPAHPRKDAPLPGYQRYFPRLQDHWICHQPLIKAIVDNHDVSKHRQTIYRGGRARTDGPWQGVFGPHAEIILQNDPRAHHSRQPDKPLSGYTLLEELAPAYSKFINQTMVLALGDARANIPLKEATFRE